MRTVLTTDAESFRQQVFAFLRTDPVLNTVMLTAVSQRAGGLVEDPAPATYAAVLDDRGVVAGAAMRTPPWSVLLSRLPVEYAGAVAEAMSVSCADASGVLGPADVALAFARRWQVLLGRSFTVRHEMRLHRLGELTPPPPVRGSARRAVEQDLDLVVDWFQAFGTEVDQPTTSEQVEHDAGERLADGRVWLWCDGDDPVCVVAQTPVVFGACRLGPVYTPSRHRGRGYAGALTAYVSARLRSAGADVCLYTDLANPTANRIYAAIGYEPVADVCSYAFG